MFKELFDTFLELFYPSLCEACGENLFDGENIICTKCRYDIPKTKFAKEDDNPIEKIFWGRVELFSATAYCYYTKGGILKNLLHKLKYKSKPEIGVELGRLLGGSLVDNPKYESVNYIIPLPLHKKREHFRGYNQSYMIAKGINEIICKEIDNNSLYRAIETKTQTKKNRFERWENVSEIFKLRNEKKLEGKHILLIDDVLTTGATIEAAAVALSKIKNIKISVAAVALSKSN